jgi:hypothetical protein
VITDFFRVIPNGVRFEISRHNHPSREKLLSLVIGVIFGFSKTVFSVSTGLAMLTTTTCCRRMNCKENSQDWQYKAI